MVVINFIEDYLIYLILMLSGYILFSSDVPLWLKIIVGVSSVWIFQREKKVGV